MDKASVLVIGDTSIWGEVAYKYVKEAGFDAKYFAWRHDEDPVPKGLGGWQGDWILSFKADYILSPDELRQARQGAVNFHPGPPNLRGVGTYHVALDEERLQYGVTCHHITEGVDAGPIIATRYFDIPPDANPLMLQEFAAAELYGLYVEIIRLIYDGKPLPSSEETWSGPLHTWKQFKERLAEAAVS